MVSENGDIFLCGYMCISDRSSVFDVWKVKV